MYDKSSRERTLWISREVLKIRKVLKFQQSNPDNRYSHAGIMAMNGIPRATLLWARDEETILSLSNMCCSTLPKSRTDHCVNNV
jgi:hypothetical protein